MDGEAGALLEGGSPGEGRLAGEMWYVMFGLVAGLGEATFDSAQWIQRERLCPL